MDLQDIPFAADENMGGMLDFKFCDPLLVDSLGYPDASNSIAQATTFTGSGAWHTGYHTPDTGRFQEGTTQGPGGMEYTYTWNCLVPGDSTTLRPLVEELERRRVLLDVRDNNLRWRRLGTTRNRPNITVSYDSGGGAPDRAGWRITATLRSSRPAPFVTEHDGSGS